MLLFQLTLSVEARKILPDILLGEPTMKELYYAVSAMGYTGMTRKRYLCVYICM